MEIESLLNRELPTIPEEIRLKLNTPSITMTPFAGKDEILSSPALHSEVGYGRFENGNYLVSMICPMPGITPHMIQWWFWWHAQDNLRYQIWYPGEHFSISYNRKNAEYFRQKELPPFRDNIQYPTERVGKVKMTLEIDFITPEEFGFSRRLMEQNDIPTIICGHVGIRHILLKHTEMAHIFKQVPNGLVLLSRFWIGEILQNPLVRKGLLTDNTARGMAEHCFVEYRSLAGILPPLYEKFAQ
jgi:hypothetical protein